VESTLVTIAILLVVGTIVVPTLLGGIAVWLVGRRFGRLVGTVLAAVCLCLYGLSPISRIGLGVIVMAAPPAQIPLVQLDLLLSRPQREFAIGMAERGELAPGPYDSLELPWWGRGLSVDGVLERVPGPCGGWFFMTITGFSPDPYGGLEYVPDGCEPEVDPLGSGDGEATEIGHRWFWIVAS
jgi:hypothetical protein